MAGKNKEFTAQCPKCDKATTHLNYPCANCGKGVYKLTRYTDDGECFFKCEYCEHLHTWLKCIDKDCNARITDKFVKQAGCFIATAVFGYDSQPTIMLRWFRDKVLLKHEPGRKFTYWYYRNSPKLLRWFGIEPK